MEQSTQIDPIIQQHDVVYVVYLFEAINVSEQSASILVLELVNLYCLLELRVIVFGVSATILCIGFLSAVSYLHKLK